MKKIVITLAVSTLSWGAAMPLVAQPIDKSAKPTPGPVKQFNLPSYSETKLSNGLKVIVVPDKRTPTFSVTYSVTPGEIADIKQGTASLVADLMTKGAGKRSALDIANLFDGIGASISASASGESFSVSAGGLKKHIETIMSVFADVVQRPAYPQQEFEKIIPQYIAGIKSKKASAGEIVQDMSRMVSYGADHPYALRQTEESVQSIVLDDVKDMYNKIFRPNGATIAIIGDVTQKEVVTMLEKHFGKWESKKPLEVVTPRAKPMPKSIYFVERPTATQSYTLLVGNTVPRNHPDYFKVNVITNLLGGGFGSRLYNTIREEYAFAYGAVAFQSGAKVDNRFAAGAEVRTSATDSTIDVVTKEMRRLNTDLIPEEELNSTRQKMIGSFFLNLENPGTIADYILSADIYDLPLEYYTTFPQKVAAVTPAELQEVARKYLNPDNMSVVVVGNPDALESVKRFGEVQRYNLDLEPISDDAGSGASISAEELLEKYTQAIGGKAALAGLKSFAAEGKMELSFGGQTAPGTSQEKVVVGEKYLMTMRTAMFQQKFLLNGESGYQEMTGQGKAELAGDELLDAKSRASAAPVLAAVALGGSLKVVSEKKGSIIATLTMPGGSQQTLYFDATTYLLTRSIQAQDTPQGQMEIVMDYKEYKDIAGVKMPTVIVNDIGGMFGMKTERTITPNVSLSDSDFK